MNLESIPATPELSEGIDIMTKSFALTLLIFIAIALTVNVLAQDNVEVGMTIKDYLESALPLQEGRTINYNELTGILTVTDTPTNHRLIRELVKQFDIGPKQILIEAKFVEISFTDLNEFGIEWYWYRQSPPSEGIFEDMGIGTTAPEDDRSGIHWDVDVDTPFPLTDFGADFIISHTSASGSFLDAYLHALAEEDKANLLAAPRVTTLEGQMANIQITRTIPYVSDIDLENEGTAEHPTWVIKLAYEEKMTGITLEVTPYVSEATNVITLELHPEISTLYAQYVVGAWSSRGVDLLNLDEDVGYPAIDVRTAQTTVKVKSGDTIMMGGFINDEDTVYDKQIPFLGDIPVLGELFKYKYQTRAKKNLVIFLTATLLTSEGEKIR